MEKLLIVSEPKQTTMFMTLKSPDAIHIVKRMLETLLFDTFGDEVLKWADKSLHPMNLKDKTRIEKWQLACEFQTDLFEVPEAKEDDSGKRARHKGPARLEILGEWANETQIVPAASDIMGAANFPEELVKQAADTVNMLTKELNELQLKEETIKREKEKKSEKLQRIDQDQ